MSVTALKPEVGSSAENNGFLFRLALPLCQLVLCALILWPIRGLIFLKFGLPGMGAPPSVFRIGAGRMFLEWSLSSGREVAAAINLPAAFLQLPTVFLTSDRTIWRPAGVDSQTWNAITLPVLGMVFWWIAGRGADALLAARRKILAPRIGWPETIVGFILGAGGLTGAIAFVFTAGPDLHDEQLQFLMSGCGLWGFLGSLIVAARIVQWRMRRKAARQLF